MNKVFLSYRRADSQDATRRMHDWLALHFAREEFFFIDIDSIHAATEFPQKLREAVAESSLMIVVIGPRWLEILNQRLSQPDPDHVRLEIEAARSAGIDILPVLLDDTPRPKPNDLPESLAFLPDIEDRHVHSDTNFPWDMQRLAKIITAIAKEPHTDFTLLLNNCRRAGLTWFDTSFGSYRQEDIIQEAQELTLVLNDGRNWLGMRKNTLSQWFRQPGKKLRYVCLHPDSPFLQTLVLKNTKPLRTQRYEILRGLIAVHEATSIRKEDATLCGSYGFNPITLLMNERRAFISHYLFTEQPVLLSFEYSNVGHGSYYDILRQDADALIDNKHSAMVKRFSEQDIEKFRDELRSNPDSR